MTEKILITSALPYANGPLHFGHIAGAYLPGDCYARFQRLIKNDVLYVCGSDEYGVAITLSAELNGKSPKEHVDLFHEVNRKLFEKLNFSFDHYSRTTWKGHEIPVHEFFKDLLANGYIEEKVTDQLYSEIDQKFLADRYVVGECPRCGFQQARGDECPECGASYEATDLKNPLSKLTKTPLVLKKTKHWFLLLDKLKDKLTQWIDSKNWKPNVLNFAKGYIQEMHPRAITRDSKWGVSIPLPHTEDKILYVWFEAPIGYISATQEWALKIGEPEKWKFYWLDPKTKLVQFIGKDNIPFHAAIFPAMCMGQNQPYKIVDELPANEFYKLEGKQFSKSEGWYIDLEDFFKRYTTDQIRYTIASNAPETSDSEFTWKDFQAKCNGDLLGKYGNLVNRVLVFAKNQGIYQIPALNNLQPSDLEFLNKIKNIIEQAFESYQTFKLRRACQLIMELAQLGNIYFDSRRPWQLAKAPENRAEMEVVIACCLDCLKALALISYPVIPETAFKVWHMLGCSEGLDSISWVEAANHSLKESQKLVEPKILFNKIENEQIEKEIANLHQMAAKVQAKSTVDYVPMKSLIDIEDIRKLDLRIGIITQARSVAKSKKLLHLDVDLGFEQRSIVSGISKFYKPEELIGKKVVVVANLKTTQLMGIKSEGMILCGEWGEDLEVITLNTLPAGSQIQ
jgi:methionyl-tRNA synthetase